MFSVVYFKKEQKKNLFLKLFTPCRAVLEQYEGDFGIINVYTLTLYKNKEKTLKKLLNTVGGKIYTEDSKIPKEYLNRLFCEETIKKAAHIKNATLTIYYIPEKQILIDLIRKFNTVYISKSLTPDLTEEIWRECGTLPITTIFPPVTDFKITGNETPTIKELPEPFSEICPKDFPPTLFAALTYKENGIFIQ